MRKTFDQPGKKVISISPLTFDANRFVSLFSQAIARQGYAVRDFRWSSFGFTKSDVIILHWPDEFFAIQRRMGLPKSLVKLAVIWIAKLLWGAKIIWIAHNAMPHDAVRSVSLVKRSFLRSLDGVVYLSEYSRRHIRSLHPEVRRCESLVTVHGHYRGAMLSPERPWAISSDNIRLLTFGRIRRYKNIDALVEAVSSIPGIDLSIAGMMEDRSLCAAIEAKAQRAPHIKTDFREDPISEAELASVVDSADAVVLPYKSILNSGAALLSLSRNRPVLAPNMGSLTELRDTVGEDWVYLYDGEFGRQVVLDFRDWVFKTKRGGVAPLNAYEWSRVGKELHDFIERVSGKINRRTG